MRKVLGLTASLMAASALALSASPAVGKTRVYKHAVAQTVHKVSPSARASAAAAPRRYARADRPIPRRHASVSPGARGAVATSSTLNAAGAKTLSNFNGVSSLDSQVTNFGLEFEPPDQGMCTGNGFVLEMVNSAYRVYRPNGTSVIGPFNVNDPFDEGAKEFTSDPRCHYDPATQRWFATVLFLNSSFTASTLDVAVSQTSDPTGLWNDYHINTTGLGGSSGPNDPGCPCFGDQPTLGMDGFNLYVTTNEFSINGPEFNGAQIFAFSKLDLVHGVTNAHFVRYTGLTSGGAVAASVQPALTNGAPQAEYFLNSLDPNATFDNRVGVWAMTNRGQVAKGGLPTLSQVVIGSEPYAIPPGAAQEGSPSLVDSGDDRMQETQSINGQVWGELTTSVTLPNNDGPRAAAAWFTVSPKLGQGVIKSATMAKQGYVALSDNYVIYPSLAVSPNGTAVMGVSLTGPNRFPSSAFTTMAPTASNFGPLTVSAAGTTNYDPNATRWGDYSWAVLDPTGTSVWLANEYVPAASSQTTDGARNWGTRVVEVPTP